MATEKHRLEAGVVDPRARRAAPAAGTHEVPADA
jgi:hypothetical protein